MTALKRVALAFCSLLLGFLLFAVVGTVPTAIHYGLRYAIPTLQILPAYLLVALPGLVLALPFVLLIKDAEGPRAWIILAIGTCIGPGVLGTWSLLAAHGHLSWQGDGPGLLMSLEIGTPTTIIYVMLLRRFGEQRLSQLRAET